MPRYSYIKLYVSTSDPRDFGVDQLREAVECLRSQPPPEIPGFTGLVAVAQVVDAGPFKLAAKPLLTLEQITGKTPAEVWEMFDRDIDEQWERLARGGKGPQLNDTTQTSTPGS